jgi:hypothetical protein
LVKKSFRFIKYEILFFLILFNTSLFSQQVEIAAVAYSTISGFTQYYQISDRNAFKNNDPREASYSQTWHSLQTLEALALINVGYTIGTNNETFLQVGTDILLTGAIRWIVRDGIYQTLLTNSFFNQSLETTAQFEKYGTPYAKFGLLFTVLIFKYFILPKL